MVVNVTSTTHNIASVDYFSGDKRQKASGVVSEGVGEVAQDMLGLGDAMKRYGSSKLLFIMSFYALQRRLDAVSPCSHFSAIF